jgi:hypothetical protein
MKSLNYKTKEMKKFMMVFALVGMILSNCGTVEAQTAKKRVCRKKARVTRVVKKTATVEKVGFIGEGTSMHCIQLNTIGSKPETLTIMVDDNTDMSKSYILEGNVAKITCVKTADGLVAKKVEGSADYYNAIGKWTMRDPIDKTKKMGVDLEVNGKASSINMASLPYTSWELQGKPGKLYLIGKSIGNGGTFDEKTVVTIFKNKKGKWFMKVDGTDVVYTREAE